MRRMLIGSDGAGRLAAVPAFAALSVGERRMLARVVEELEADAGETLMREGEPGYEVIVLEEGAAEVLQGGRRINVVGPGDVVGELAVLAVGGPRTASVVATEPLRAIVLTAHFMREVNATLPAVAQAVGAAAAEHVTRDERDGRSPAGA